MKKKLLALILACLMVLPVIVSCKKDDSADETTADTKAPSDSGDEYAYIDDYVDELAADYNYDGVTFNMLDNGTSYPEVYEETGNLEDDALYYRYRDLEEKFGIELNRIVRTEEGTSFDYSGEAIADDVKRDQYAEGASYDLVCGGMVSCGQNLVSSNVIRSVLEVPGLNLEKSWWIPDIENKFSIAGDLYYLTGKIVESHYTNTQMLVFSKDVVRDYNMTENLYEIVEAGEWTIDKMFEVASVIPANTSGSGAYRYLWHRSGENGYAFYEAGGFSLTGRDEDNNPTVAASLTSDQQNYISKLADVFGDHTQNFDVETYEKENGYDQPDSEYVVFGEKRFLFTLTGLGGITTLRDESIEIGILPMPKRNTEQANYQSFSSGWLMYGVYLPKTLKDEEMSGVITEAMAALSEKYMEPAYYEKALQGRSTYDLESRDMLDIIYNTTSVDLTECYHSIWGNLYTVVGEAVMGKTDSVTSGYSSTSKVINRKISQMIKRIEKARE